MIAEYGAHLDTLSWTARIEVNAFMVGYLANCVDEATFDEAFEAAKAVTG